MSKIKTAIKSFFSSLWGDFKQLCKSHVWRILGFVVSFIVPIAWMLFNYVDKVEDQTKFTIPFAVILPLVILVIVYWCKLKSYISAKVVQMKTENAIDKGKHAGAIIVCDTIKVLFTIIPFALFYVLIKALEKYAVSMADIFLFVIICEAVGGLFAILDTIHNVVDFESDEIKKLEEEIKDNK